MTHLFLFIVYSFFLFSSSLLAHTIKPAYLEIKSIEKYSYQTKWKVPLNGNNPSVSPVFPSICQEKTLYRYRDDTILFSASRVDCNQTLFGKSISIQNIQKERMRVIFHFSEDNTSFFTELSPTRPNITIDKMKNTKEKEDRQNDILLGIEHILLGYDHLLFVLGLLLLIRNTKTLIQTITAFTLAHSITLGASALGIVHIPELFIESIIALSIVVLAVEILYKQKKIYGFSTKYPWLAALFFGLIHGFGFANVLADLSLPQEHIIHTLLFFNIGIELGQLLFIILLMALYYILSFFIREHYILQGKILIAYSIGVVGTYWLIERLSKLLI